jgi:enoyl-CoA hydratase/carnithine racemase
MFSLDTEAGTSTTRRYGAVRIDRPVDGVGVVVLNRPHRMNALSPSTAPEVAEAVASLGAEENIRAIVLTGAGRGFCAGMDLGALDEMAPREIDATVEWMRGVHGCSLALDRLLQPTIAAVNGPAIGGGFGIALGCDIRIAGPPARFGATFSKMSLGPDGGLSRSLAAIVGHARALELLLTGDLLDAADALRLGIVSAMVEDPLGAAIALAQRFAAVPSHTSRAIKSAMRRAASADMTTALYEIEPAMQAELICHPDFFTFAMGWINAHSSNDSGKQ